MKLREGRSVIGHIGESSIASVVGVTHDIGLSDEASLLEITVGDMSFGISKDMRLAWTSGGRVPTRCGGWKKS